LDPAKMWSLIIEERVSIAGAVPAILNFMRQVPEFAELDAPGFRFFMTGGAPMPGALIEMYAAKNMQVMQGYALTESCGSGTVLLVEYALRKSGSAGGACMFADVRVRTDDGVISESGEGEVVIKSDFLLKEYWNRSDATRDAFDNGWFRTGDIGEIDKEGYLYIKDRLKDMIISGGENIYPAEIESVVIGVPRVSEVAVIGFFRGQGGGGAGALRGGRPEQGQRGTNRRVLRHTAGALQAAQKGDLRRGNTAQPSGQDPQAGAPRTVPVTALTYAKLADGFAQCGAGSSQSSALQA